MLTSTRCREYSSERVHANTGQTFPGLREDQIIGIFVLAAAIPMLIRLTMFGRAPEPLRTT